MNEKEKKIIEQFTRSANPNALPSTKQWRNDYAGERIISVLFVIYYAISLGIIYSFIGRREIGALHFIPLLGAAVPAAVLSQLTWNIIGEPVKEILRWIADRWVRSLMVLMIILFILARLQKGIPLENILHAQGIMNGENWSIPKNEQKQYLKLTYNEALSFCEKLGAGWRLLLSSDFEKVRPTPIGHEKIHFWLSDPIQENKYKSYLYIEEKQQSINLKKGLIDASPEQRFPILCIRE